MNGLDPQTQTLIDQFMAREGYTKAGVPGTPQVEPQLPTEWQSYIDKFMINQGFEKLGEVYEPLKVEKPTMEEAVARIPQEEVKAYMDKPGFWQQMFDMARLATERDPHTLMMGLESLAQGISQRNFPYVVNLVGKIAGVKDLYGTFKAEQDKSFKEKIGYVPDPEAKVFATAPTEMAGALATLGGIIRAADVPARLITKVPFLRSLGRGFITGTATGMIRRPEDEDTILNRAKQVPGDVAFFALLDTGLLTVNQAYRIYLWNKRFKPRTYTMTAEEFGTFANKIASEPGPDGMPIGLTDTERTVFQEFKGKGGWESMARALRIAKREGRPFEMKITPEGAPPKPTMRELFRRPIYEPGEAPPPRPEEEAEPPRPEEPTPPPPGEPTPPRRGAPPSVVVRPTTEGGWRFEFEPQAVRPPTVEPGIVGRPTPTGIIPWIPRDLPPHIAPPAPEAIVPEVVPAKPRAPRKPKKFKDPMLEFINFHFKGVKPTATWTAASLRQVLPFDLIRNDGEALDVIAQAMENNGFPSITGDRELYDALDLRRRGAKYQEAATGDEYLPPPDYYEAEYESWKETHPEGTEESFSEWKRTDWRTTELAKRTPEQIEALRRDIRQNILDLTDELNATTDASEKIKIRKHIDSWNDDLRMINEELRGRGMKVREERDLFGKPIAEPEKPKPPKPEEPKLVEIEEVTKYPTGFDTRGIKIVKDINVAREQAQPLIDDGYQVEIGQTPDNKGYLKLGELKKPGEGKLTYKGKAVKPEFVEKPEVELEIPEEKPTLIKEPERKLTKGEEALRKMGLVEEEKPTAPKPEEIEAALKEEKIEPKREGAFKELILRYYKPEEWKSLNDYIRSAKKYVTPEGEIKGRPGAKPPVARVEPGKAIDPESAIAAGKVEGPEDIFAKAEEEVKVRDIIIKASKDPKQADVLLSRIMKDPADSFETIAKRLGMSEEGVRQSFYRGMEKLKDMDEVKEILRRRMKQANLGPIPSSEELNRLAKLLNKYFTTRKGVAEGIDSANDTRIGAIKAEFFESSLEDKEIRKFLRKNRNIELNDFVIDALTGKIDVETTALPTEIKDLISRMRNRIDKLSMLIIVEGGLARNTLASFERNLGKYLGRYYRMYESKRWDPPQATKDAWANWLRDNYPKTFGAFTEEEMADYIEATLRKRDFIYRRSGKRTKKIPTGHFIKRKDLPKEFRNFAGEVADPAWLYIKTVSDQAVMAYNAEFLNKIYDTYPDLWTKDYATAASRGWQNNQLPKGYGYGKLRGHYVHPELDNYIRREISPIREGMMNLIQRFMMNPFKWTKTIGSIPTHARNFLGNTMFSILMRNANTNPANWPYYWKGLRIFFGKESTFKKEWADMIRRGVTETQFWGAEIPAFYNELLKLDPPSWPEAIWNKTVKYGIDKVGKLYNLEDLIYRMAADVKNIEHFKMTPQESVEEINRGMTNYRKLPLVADFLRRWTFLGPFISFRWNVGKIIVNQLTQGAKEAGQSGTRWKGLKRLWRTLFVLAVPSIIAKVANENLKKIHNIDPEDIKELESFYPDYRRQGTFVYFYWNGKLKAFDLTYTWPTGEFERAIRSVLAGDVEGVVTAMNLFAHPIFDAYSILIRGRDPYWDTKLPATGSWIKDGLNRVAEIAKAIYLPASAPIPSFKGLLKGEVRPGKLTGYQLRAILKAYLQEPDQYGKVKSLPEEVKNFFTGLRTWNVEPEKLIIQSARADRAQMNEILGRLRSWLRNNTKAPAWEIADRKADAMRAIKKIQGRLKRANELLLKIHKEKW